jgi:hypothetical protein
MHTCPDCGQDCYCHGDIDDCVVEIEAYSAAHCKHYLTEECSDLDAYYELDDSDST